MRRLLRTAILFLVVCRLPEAARADGDCRVAAAAARQAASIRGLALRRQVPCRLQGKAEVRSFLTKTLSEPRTSGRLRADERILEALGFLPRGTDLGRTVLAFYSAQIGGYYDPKTERYAMADWLPASLQPTVAVHELTHALQDQHFDLDLYLSEDSLTSDELLARQAVVEGDATAVMNDAAREAAGLAGLANIEDVTSLLLPTVASLGLSVPGAEVPEAVKLTAVFPYTSGLLYVHHALRRGGYRAVDGLYRTPPRSTSEVLRPGRVPAPSPRALRVKPRDPAGDVYADRLGEFFVVTLLGTGGVDKNAAVKAADGWRDDVVELEGGRVRWRTEWADDKEAEEFRAAFDELLTRTSAPGARPQPVRSGSLVTFEASAGP